MHLSGKERKIDLGMVAMLQELLLSLLLLVAADGVLL
jgi:hypothetical protein